MSESKYKKGDRVISKVSSFNIITKGKAYIVSRTGHTFTRIIDDSNNEFRLTHDKFDHYFELLQNDHLPEHLRDNEFLREMGYRRLANPSCTCGAWSVKDSGHDRWCDIKSGA